MKLSEVSFALHHGNVLARLFKAFTRAFPGLFRATESISPHASKRKSQKSSHNVSFGLAAKLSYRSLEALRYRVKRTHDWLFRYSQPPWSLHLWPGSHTNSDPHSQSLSLLQKA
ncbi:MAG: hypothetical protein CSA75_03355 [Sorangium cellulosum]|nr:MAG: hypothetical protein CSA75_03355 [Sorangium cellulosum]